MTYPSPVADAETLVPQAILLADDEDALDVIYTTIDAWMTAGDWVNVRLALERAPVATLPLVRALAFLSITSPARGEPGMHSPRAEYARQLRARLERDQPERVEALLQGIE